jgi:prophage regulatory protein
MDNKQPQSSEQEKMPLILRKKQVLAMIGLSATTIYLMQQEGRFPLPIKLSRRATGWLSSDIQRWLNEKADERAA